MKGHNETEMMEIESGSDTSSSFLEAGYGFNSQEEAAFWLNEQGFYLRAINGIVVLLCLVLLFPASQGYSFWETMSAFLFLISLGGCILGITTSAYSSSAYSLQQKWNRIFLFWCLIVIVYCISLLSTGEFGTIAETRCKSPAIVSAYRNSYSYCKSNVEKQMTIQAVLVLLMGICIMGIIYREAGCYLTKVGLLQKIFDDLAPTVIKADIKSNDGLDDAKDGLFESRKEAAEVYQNSFDSLRELSLSPSASIEEIKTKDEDLPFPQEVRFTCQYEYCTKEANQLQCPICNSKGYEKEKSFFCSQDHFNKAWEKHEVYHATKSNKIGALSR